MFFGKLGIRMAVNPFTRGTSPGRARPPHRGSFKMGHEKRGGRKKGTPNAISARARKAIWAAAKRVPRTTLNRNHWQWVIEKNPLINEARERQGQFTLTGPPRRRSRTFTMKSYCQDLSAVAMRAIQTDQFVDLQLVQCLTELGVRDPSEFAKILAIAAPKQSYLAARPHAEMVDPREAINPGPSHSGMAARLRPDAQLVDTGPSRPGADSRGRLPRGLWLTSQSGARLELEVRPRGKPFSPDRATAQNADSGMDAPLRREERLRDTGPRRPQTEPGRGLPPGVRLAALPGARLEMGVQSQDRAIGTDNRR
jgi:hypothetical protein